jgi:death-on-curing protein
MKRLHWLSVEGVQAIHADLIARYGGSVGLRDQNLLASAIARPIHLHTYEPETTVARLTASLGWELVKNHAFVDGNKRIALAAMVTFLELNGHEPGCSEAEETYMVLRAAASEIDVEEWNDWLEDAARSKPV